VELPLVKRMLEAKCLLLKGSLTGQELKNFETHRKKELFSRPLDGWGKMEFFTFSIPKALELWESRFIRIFHPMV